MSLVQDACACDQAHALCLEDGDCLTQELQKTLCRQCIDDGCTKAQCSTTDYMHCSNGDAMDCDAAYFQCSNAIIAPLNSRERCRHGTIQVDETGMTSALLVPSWRDAVASAGVIRSSKSTPTGVLRVGALQASVGYRRRT